jgi:hypothetical protein
MRPVASYRPIMSHCRRNGRTFVGVLLAVLAVVLGIAVGTVSAAAAPAGPATFSPFGSHVLIFDPSMPQADIQTRLDAIANEQIGNQFGDDRYALLFKPGVYGSAGTPLNFQVGYYTEVAGLGQNPGDVVLNGTIDVFNQCDNGFCTALNNFWRSVANLTINVANPQSGPYSGCYNGEFWAVSQAAPMRRVQVNGQTTLMDYCSAPSYASGGFIADSRFGGTVINGSQQQFVVRNTALTSWTNGVWNQVFAGDENAPAQCFPAVANGCGPYTTLATTPASRERPYLYLDGHGAWRVFVPSAQRNSTGPTWSASTQTSGRSLPLADFYVASPTDSAHTINRQLARGKNLLLTPGVYDVDRTLQVRRANTVVLGLGYATLTPTRGNVALATGDVPGIDLAGIIVDAGAENSPALVRIGTGHPGPRSRHSSAANPTALQDVFFRIGGPHLGKATVSLLVNSDHVVLDDIWAWRADHGNGVGWTQNTAATGLVVNGDDVNATGLFVEHYQRHEVLWNGDGGSVVFFQNEMPYDVPSQAAWQANAHTQGYPAFTVADRVRRFTGYGMGSYSFFNQGVDVYAANAFQVPIRSGVTMHDLLTVFLDGSGAIDSVVNGTGAPVTLAQQGAPSNVVSYP